MYIRKFVLVVTLILSFAVMTYAEVPVSQIFNKYSSSVVTIVALDENEQPLSLGSGFFITTDGNIVTNHHILEGSSKAIIKTTEGQLGEIVEIINDDPELDLLIAKTSLKNTNPLPLGDSDTITIGENIIAIGNPAGLEGTVSTGIVSGVRKINDFKLIQITAPISPGSSGGPVFNKDGRVIGIATAYLEYGQNLNFAMPVNYLQSLKTCNLKIGSLPKMVPTSGALSRDNSLVQVFNTHLDSSCGSIDYIDFGIKNNSNYSIYGIKIFFIYRNRDGEVISYSSEHIYKPILPHLALQFTHRHEVKYFGRFDSKSGKCIRGTVEIRVLDYTVQREDSTSPVDVFFE